MKSSGTALSIREFQRLAVSTQLLEPGSRLGIAASVEGAGPVRTLGGIEVYLALRARIPGLHRERLEEAVEQREVQVLPAARGCIYLVSGKDAGAVLTFAAQQRAGRDSREYSQAGIRGGELEELGRMIVDILGDQRLSTTELRKRLPEESVRSLGDAGKKVGISSTLPPALRLLEFQGSIARFMDGRRLDSERYLWGALSDPPPGIGADSAQVNCRMAKIFFQAAGLATLKMFTSWSGLSQTAARSAIEPLKLQVFQLEGEAEPFLGQPGLPTASVETVAFLPFEDNLVALRGGPRLFVDPRYREIPVPVWGRSSSSTLGEARHSSLRSILVANQIAGFWEFNPETREVETCCFADLKPGQREQVRARARDLEQFIACDLGHGRSFSLDSDASLMQRVAFIRKLQGESSR